MEHFFGNNRGSKECFLSLLISTKRCKFPILYSFYNEIKMFRNIPTVISPLYPYRYDLFRDIADITHKLK